MDFNSLVKNKSIFLKAHYIHLNNSIYFNRSIVLALLAAPDTPTLLETVRLVKICVSIDSCCNYWLSSIVNNIDDFASFSQFILSSSTNGKIGDFAFSLFIFTALSKGRFYEWFSKSIITIKLLK